MVKKATLKLLPNERELGERFRAGDEAAFNDLYLRHLKPLENYIRKLPRMAAQRDKNELAQDIAADAFISAWNNGRSTFDPDKGPFSTWLYRIATNACTTTLNLRDKSRDEFLEIFFPGPKSAPYPVICSGCGAVHTTCKNKLKAPGKFICKECGLSQFEEGDNKHIRLQPSEKRSPKDTSLDYHQAVEALSGVELGFALTKGEKNYVPTQTDKDKEEFEGWAHEYAPKLSRRENKIVSEIIKATPRDKIAKNLDLKPGTLETAISRIRKKYQVEEAEDDYVEV